MMMKMVEMVKMVKMVEMVKMVKMMQWLQTCVPPAMGGRGGFYFCDRVSLNYLFLFVAANLIQLPTGKNRSGGPNS
jgi:hypothetical protein